MMRSQFNLTWGFNHLSTCPYICTSHDRLTYCKHIYDTSMYARMRRIVNAAHGVVRARLTLDGAALLSMLNKASIEGYTRNNCVNKYVNFVADKIAEPPLNTPRLAIWERCPTSHATLTIL